MLPDSTNDGHIQWEDWRGGLATFSSIAGFTQIPMTYAAAEAIAKVLGVSFSVKEASCVAS